MHGFSKYLKVVIFYVIETQGLTPMRWQIKTQKFIEDKKLEYHIIY